MGAVAIEALTVADEPAAWAAVGFAVDGDACAIGGVRLRFAGRAAGRGIVGWALRGAAGARLVGLPTTVADGDGDLGAGGDGRSRADDVAPPPAHPNGVTAIDHVVVVTPALERTVAALEAAGLDLRRIRERPTPAGAPRQAFFRLGAVIVEVVQEPDEAVARGGGADRPARFWGLALRVDDLDGAVARLGPERVGAARPAVQPGRRIATVRRAAGLAVPVALMTPPPRAHRGPAPAAPG
jgi:hypothetical protein